MENENILIIALWLLYNVESIDEVKFDDVLAGNIKEYKLKDRRYLYSVIDSLKKDFDFNGLLTALPNGKKLKFSNDEVFEYIKIFKSFMENKEFGILKNDESVN